MKQIQLRFEPDPSLDHIEVLIHAPEEDEQVKALLRRLSGSAPATLTVFDSFERQHLLRAEDIVSVSADGKQVRIVTEGELFYLRQTMRSVEETLDPQRFVRISRYEIVNLAKVVSFDFTLAGTLRLELAGGMETWASRRCIPAIRSRLTGKE